MRAERELPSRDGMVKPTVSEQDQDCTHGYVEQWTLHTPRLGSAAASTGLR